MAKNEKREQNSGPSTHVLFRRATGAIIGMHRSYDASTQTYLQLPRDEVIALYRGMNPDADFSDIDVVVVDPPNKGRQSVFLIDPKTRQLAPAPTLRIQAKRVELQGDGKDSVALNVSAVAQNGRVQRDFTADVQVRTTRGKLSSSGGRLKLERGEGKITLISSPETVDSVLVSVRDPLGRATPGGLKLSFL
jgi:hypothetical protein